MATKQDPSKPPQRKLTLSKETIRDLTPKNEADVVKGGAVVACTEDRSTCTGGHS